MQWIGLLESILGVQIIQSLNHDLVIKTLLELGDPAFEEIPT